MGDHPSFKTLANFKKIKIILTALSARSFKITLCETFFCKCKWISGHRQSVFKDQLCLILFGSVWKTPTDPPPPSPPAMRCGPFGINIIQIQMQFLYSACTWMYIQNKCAFFPKTLPSNQKHFLTVHSVTYLYACHCVNEHVSAHICVCVCKCLHTLIDNWMSMWVSRTDEKIGCSLFLLLATMVILMLFPPSFTLNKCALHLCNDVRVFLGKLNTLRFTEIKKVNNYTCRVKKFEL